MAAWEAEKLQYVAWEADKVQQVSRGFLRFVVDSDRSLIKTFGVVARET